MYQTQRVTSKCNRIQINEWCQKYCVRSEYKNRFRLRHNGVTIQLDMYLHSESRRNKLNCYHIKEKILHHEFPITISLEFIPFLQIIKGYILHLRFTEMHLGNTYVYKQRLVFRVYVCIYIYIYIYIVCKLHITFVVELPLNRRFYLKNISKLYTFKE